VKGVLTNKGTKEGHHLLKGRYSTAIAFARWPTQLNRHALADVCTWQENKMSNLIDFEHLQTVLLSIAYARIKTFFLIAGRYYDDKIINVKTF